MLLLKTVVLYLLLSLLGLCAAGSLAVIIASRDLQTAWEALTLLLVYVQVWGSHGIRYFVMPHLLSMWTAALTTWWLATSSAPPVMKISAATCIGLWITWKIRTDRKEAAEEKKRSDERSELSWSFRSRMIDAQDKLIVAERKLAKLAV